MTTGNFGWEQEGLRKTGEAFLHSRRMVEFARVILRILSRFDREHGMNVTICITVNAGPITGGVVGHTKYSYDVFGETVDHARAMLSESQANTVLVSRSVHDSIHDPSHRPARPPYPTRPQANAGPRL